jgi:hypothetical protein
MQIVIQDRLADPDTQWPAAMAPRGLRVGLNESHDGSPSEPLVIVLVAAAVSARDRVVWPFGMPI